MQPSPASDDAEPDPIDEGSDDGGDHDDGSDDGTVALRSTLDPADPEVLEVLGRGAIRTLGFLPHSSNGAFLVEVHHEDNSVGGVYKPGRGEQPLWDFPSGLFRREVAAFELSRALDWALVPPTVLREGPFGAGSVQMFIMARFSEHYFSLHESGTHHEALRRLCLFDLIVNSADRKGGHVLVDARDRVWAIDNGLAFHEELKLRTVIWDYAGSPIPDPLRADLEELSRSGLPEALGGLLDDAELEATRARLDWALTLDSFPHDPTGRRYPWPLI